MKKLILIIVFTILLQSCTKEDTAADPIIGKWYLKEFYNDNVLQTLNECSLQKSIEFKNTGYYNEDYFSKDTIKNICKAEGNSGGKWSNLNNIYEIDPTSIFYQQQKIELKKDKLIFSFEGWHFVGNEIETSEIISIYKKNN